MISHVAVLMWETQFKVFGKYIKTHLADMLEVINKNII